LHICRHGAAHRRVNRADAPNAQSAKEMMMKTTIRGRKIDFMFDDGAEHVLTFDADRVHSALHNEAEMYGWNTRLTRAGALSTKDSKGNARVVTEAMRRDAVKTLMEHYHGGADTWSMKVSACAPGENPAIQALAAAMGLTYAQAELKIQDMAIAALMGNGGEATGGESTELG
jgi:hypothetical protein